MKIQTYELLQTGQYNAMKLDSLAISSATNVKIL